MYLSPPALPVNYVCRQNLLDEMVAKLFQTISTPANAGMNLVVTGPGGYGKTTLVKALCYYNLIQEMFTDGFVFVELGPKATDPSMMLCQLYHLLTGQNFRQGNINLVMQEINQITSAFFRNLLVIIDDVWHVEDAEPIVEAFSNCAIVLTTRNNEIGQCIPTKETVVVGPMEQSEAISLLTCGVFEISELSQEDVSILDELVQDVHLWPLLLSLVKGHLHNNLKVKCLSSHEAIQTVQTKLHHKGLKSFDKNIIENVYSGRKFAVKICIEFTLDLLTKELCDRIKILMLYTGIGSSVQTAVLHFLWKVTEHEAKDTIDVLRAYGLVYFKDVILYPHNNKQSCVQVHSVISQFVIENMESLEVYNLSPFVRNTETMRSVGRELALSFQRSYGVDDLSTLSDRDFLLYRMSLIENHELPSYLSMMNMLTISDPHFAILTLQRIKAYLKLFNCGNFLLYIEQLIAEYRKILYDSYKLSRSLNQKFQHNLLKRNFGALIQTVKDYMKTYPSSITAENSVNTFATHAKQDYVKTQCQTLQMMTRKCHAITTKLIPRIELQIKMHQRISTLLLAGPSDVEQTSIYIILEVVNANSLNKIKEFIPNFPG